MITMNQLTANLIRLEKAESFLSYSWPLGLRPNLETQIKLLRRHLPPRTIALYNQLKERGDAVAEVVEGVCQGCQQPVAPSFLHQIDAGEDTACCPNCGRFLYIKCGGLEQGQLVPNPSLTERGQLVPVTSRKQERRPVAVPFKKYKRSRW